MDGDLFSARRNRVPRHNHRPIFGSPTQVPGNRETLIGADLGRCRPRARPLSPIGKSTRPKPSTTVSFFSSPLSVNGLSVLIRNDHNSGNKSQNDKDDDKNYKSKNDGQKNTEDKKNDNNNSKDSNLWWK